MATTVQQLLDDLAAKAVAAPPATPIEEVATALGHLGRALSRLANDGLTADVGPRDRAAARLGRACAIVAALWPATSGPLVDLAGAAADVLGRDRDLMGRSHRWAITVELAVVADESARLGRRLRPQAAVAELTAVRRLAAGVERDAQTDPPTASGSVILDRLLPAPGIPHGATDMTAADASAALAGVLGRAQRADDLTLREFRAATAAAEISSRYGAVATAVATGGDARPLLVAAAAWQLAGRISLAFDDGRRSRPTDPRGVVPWAQALAGALHADVGSDVDIAALRDRQDVREVLSRTRQGVNQLPLLGEQLAAVVDHWSRTGQLYAHARDLPPMEEMPVDRVRDVVAGRRVQACGPDLDILGRAVHRAGELSTALADTFNRAVPDGPSVQRHLVDNYAGQVRAPGAAERLLRHAQAVTEALAATRAPLTGPVHGSDRLHRPGM